MSSHVETRSDRAKKGLSKRDSSRIATLRRNGLLSTGIFRSDSVTSHEQRSLLAFELLANRGTKKISSDLSQHFATDIDIIFRQLGWPD